MFTPKKKVFANMILALSMLCLLTFTLGNMLKKIINYLPSQ